MQPAEIVYFAVTLFLALYTLIKWKRRRDIAAARVNRGLREYATARKETGIPGTKMTRTGKREDGLIPA